MLIQLESGVQKPLVRFEDFGCWQDDVEQWLESKSVDPQARPGPEDGVVVRKVETGGGKVKHKGQETMDWLGRQGEYGQSS